MEKGLAKEASVNFSNKVLAGYPGTGKSVFGKERFGSICSGLIGMDI